MNKITLLANLQKYLKSSSLIEPNEESLSRFANHEITPLATLLCNNITDIQVAIKYCNQNSIDFVVKSGGANQAATSIRANSLVLDLSPLKQISHVHSEDGVLIKFEAGVSFGDLQDYLGKFNRQKGVGYTMSLAWLRSISAIGAHTVMGNGLFHRICGVGVDLIKQARVILSSGEIVTASSSQNQDLLWGVKGCGPNMGVILQVSEWLSEGQCNVIDPLGREQIRTYSSSFPISKASSAIGCDFSELYANLNEKVFPYLILAKNSKQSIAYLFVYEALYDKKVKKLNQQRNIGLENMLKGLRMKWNGRNNMGEQFISQKIVDVAIKPNQAKKFYYIWGGYTTLHILPKVIQEISIFFEDNSFTQSDISISTSIVFLESSSFQSRDESSASWPCGRQHNVMVYGNISYEKKDNHQWCKLYLDSLESALKKYFFFGSACDVNPHSNLDNRAHWIYGKNYEKLKQVRQKYDSLNKFANGLF